MPARLRFRHLSGPRSGEVDEVSLPPVPGSGAEADVRAPGASPRHALVIEREGEIVLQSADEGRGTWLDGEPVREAVLRDGDVLRLGPYGPRVRLEAADEAGQQLLKPAPWSRPRQGLADLAGLARTIYGQTSPLVRGLLAVAPLAEQAHHMHHVCVGQSVCRGNLSGSVSGKKFKQTDSMLFLCTGWNLG